MSVAGTPLPLLAAAATCGAGAGGGVCGAPLCAVPPPPPPPYPLPHPPKPPPAARLCCDLQAQRSKYPNTITNCRNVRYSHIVDITVPTSVSAPPLYIAWPALSPLPPLPLPPPCSMLRACLVCLRAAPGLRARSRSVFGQLLRAAFAVRPCVVRGIRPSLPPFAP